MTGVDPVGVHRAHCDQGEYVGSCKYGEPDCPVMANRPAAAAPLTSLRNTLYSMVDVVDVTPPKLSDRDFALIDQADKLVKQASDLLDRVEALK